MDDESNFTFSKSALSGNRGFYSSSTELTPPVVKYAGIKKFRKRLQVWAVISGNGVSKIYIIDRVMVEQHVYLDILEEKFE